MDHCERNESFEAHYASSIGYRPETDTTYVNLIVEDTLRCILPRYL